MRQKNLADKLSADRLARTADPAISAAEPELRKKDGYLDDELRRIKLAPDFGLGEHKGPKKKQ